MTLTPADIQAIVTGLAAELAPLLRPDDDWVTPERAAQIIGCRKGTLRRHVTSGRLIDNQAGRGGNTLYRLDTVKACRFYKMNSSKLIK